MPDFVLKIIREFGAIISFTIAFIIPIAVSVLSFPDFALSPIVTLELLIFLATFSALMVSIATVVLIKQPRSIAICLLLLILVLSINKPELLKTSDHWGHDRWPIKIFKNYLFQVTSLIIIPLQVGLWRLNFPVIKWTKRCFIALGLFQCAVVLLQLLSISYENVNVFNVLGLYNKSYYTVRDGSRHFQDASRLTGTLNSPILLSMLLVMTWPAILFSSTCVTKQSKRTIILLALLKAPLVLIFLWAVCHTYTRAAYIALSLQIATITLYWFKLPKLRFRLGVALVIIFSCLLAAISLTPHSAERFGAITDISDRSITNRLFVYVSCVEFLLERPLSGWGASFFYFLYNTESKLPGVNYVFYDVHSSVFNVLMEIGVIGVALSVVIVTPFKLMVFFNRAPVWMIICFVGIIIPFLVDNPSACPALLFLIVWLTGVLLITVMQIDNEINQNILKSRLRIFHWVCFVLFAIWLIGYFQPIRPVGLT